MSFEVPPPDPTNPDLLIGIFTYLHERGAVREPMDEANQYKMPTMWIEQRQGYPAPGEEVGNSPVEVTPTLDNDGPGLVVGIDLVPGIPSGPYEGFLRSSHVQFTLRSSRPDLAFKFEQKLRELINDKRGWMMANIPVNESLLYRDLQPIGSDNLGWVHTLEYSFLLWGPFTPVGH